MSHVEDKMGDFAAAHNKLVDAYNGREEEMQAIKCKLADHEDRSRRNNIKLPMNLYPHQNTTICPAAHIHPAS